MHMYLFRCKVFRDATAAREVGRCMAVHREWRLHWWDKERFLSVLGECAATGNPEASYILGLVTSEAQIQNRIIFSCSCANQPSCYNSDIFFLCQEEICNRRGKESGLRHLHHAMKHGHAVAAYTIGMIMLRDAYNLEGIEEAMGYLEGCSAARTKSKIKIASVRREAASVVRRLTMRRWRTAVPAAPCADPRCGEMETAEAWDEDDEQRRFCSRLCRWKHEYRKFVQRI